MSLEEKLAMATNWVNFLSKFYFEVVILLMQQELNSKSVLQPERTVLLV